MNTKDIRRKLTAAIGAATACATLICGGVGAAQAMERDALGGSVLNFFLYTVLRNVTFSFYPLRLIVCVLSFAVSAFGCTLVLETHLMRTPMEGCIQLLAERMGTTMGKLRQKIDIVLVLVSVAITLIFGVEWTLREGTIIAALIFGPMMDFWKKTVFSGKSA